MHKLLLVEDEKALGPLIVEALTRKGFSVQLATSGNQALLLYKQTRPDLCILDVMLPGMDGFTLAKEIKKINAETPVLFLTAKSQTSDVIKGFESGGNDYLKKPFSIDELVLRIKELLSRYISHTGNVEQQIHIGVFVFYPGMQILKNDSHKVSLSHRESALLLELAIEKNNVVERKRILQKLWGDDNFFNGRNMDVYIVKLRKRLEADSNISIINIRGIGYKLVETSD